MRSSRQVRIRKFAALRLIAVLFAFSTIFSFAQFASADAGDDMVNLAFNYYSQKRYDMARDKYEEFLTKYGTSGTHARKNEAMYYLAESYLKLNQISEAAAHFDALIKQNTKDEFSKLALYRAGEEAFWAGSYDYARPLLVEFVSRYGGNETTSADPYNAYVLPYLGKITLDENKPEESVYYFSASLSLFPKGEKANESKFGLGCALALQGEYNDAETYFTQLLQNKELGRKAEYQLAVLSFQKGNARNAITSLNSLLRKSDLPQGMSDDIYRTLTRCYGELGEYDQALSAHSKIKANNASDDLLKVRCLYNMDKIDDAQKLLDQLDRSVSGDTVKDEINFIKAMMLVDQKDWRNALVLLERLLEPRYDTYSKSIAINYFNAQAAVGVTPSIKLSQDSFLQACSLLSITYANRGDYDKARASYAWLAMYAKQDNDKTRNLLYKTSEEIDKLERGSGGMIAGDGDGTNPRPGGSGSRPGGGRPGRPGSTTELVPIVPDGGSGGIATVPPFTQPGTGTGTSKPGNGFTEEVGGTTVKNDHEHAETISDAKSLYRKRRYDEADRLLLELLRKNPSQSIMTEAALWRGKTLEAKGNERDANRICYEVLIEQYPDCDEYAEALWLSGRYLEKQGDESKAIKRFQTLVDRFPNSKFVDGAMYYLAWDELSYGSEREAKSMLTRIYRNNKDGEYWSHATWMLAQMAYKEHNYTQSEKYIRELLRNPPDEAVFDRVLFLRGQLAMETKKWDVAVAAFEALTQHCPDSDYYNDAIDYSVMANHYKNAEVRR